jgi:hypothetical protein
MIQHRRLSCNCREVTRLRRIQPWMVLTEIWNRRAISAMVHSLLPFSSGDMEVEAVKP